MAHEAPQLENEGVGSELTDDVLVHKLYINHETRQFMGRGL